MDTFQAIAEPTRRDIIELLAKNGRLSASTIGSRFTISSPAISQHLKVLRDAHIVRVEKQGQHRIYQLEMNALTDLEKWSQHMTHLWNTRFDKLDAVLKTKKK